MSQKLKNDLLIRACRNQPVERTPVWIMRQAGRYLPEYQKVRSKTDFLTMCHTPDLAAEVTLQPVDILGVDAAIIFSDILVIPAAMGMDLNFYEGRGPVFERPLRQEEDFKNLHDFDTEEKLDFALDAIKSVKQQLAYRVPLIGFAGAPWTLAAYMVEGSGSRNFLHIKQLMYHASDLLKNLLGRLSSTVAQFLKAQIRAGADVVQIFDSWAGILTPDDFNTFSFPYIKKIVEEVREMEVPIIVFARGAEHSIESLSEIGADVLSISWQEDLASIKKRLNGHVVLQGNLDPSVLFAPTETIRSEVRKILEKANKQGHIFNLGHGILPQTPVENAKAMVEIVKEESTRLRS